MVKEKCCHLDRDKLECPADASFRILPAEGEDCYSDTYACTLHVGYMLTDNPKGHLVVPHMDETH